MEVFLFFTWRAAHRGHASPGCIRRATRPASAPPIIPMLLPAIYASLFIALVLTFGPHPSQASLTGGLIAADRGRFVREDGSTFRVAGTNCFYLAYSSGADDGSYEHAWVR